MADAPVIFYQDPEVIYNRMIANYGTRVGRPVQQQQAEALLFRTLAYEVSLIRATGDIGVAQNLVAFSSAPMLDYVGETFGVRRQPAAPASTTMVFTLLPGHAQVTVIKGTKIRSQDGVMVFQTDQDVTAAPGTDTLEVTATAMLDGPQGNLYPVGYISSLIDVQPFIVGVSNKYVTAGGADIETDPMYQNRISIAQNQNTTAGSTASYKFWALSANPSIIDVSVVAPKDADGVSVGGQVRIYPLITGGGTTPQAILDQVYVATSGENRRPVNDKVIVLSPTRREYTIKMTIVLKAGVPQTEYYNVIARFNAYAARQAQKLGADVTESQIKAACMSEFVHSMPLQDWTDIIVNPQSFAVCTGILNAGVIYEDPNA